MASGTEAMSFQFCFILIKLHLNSSMWLVAAILDRTGRRDVLLSLGAREDFPSLSAVEATPPKGQGIMFSLHREFRVCASEMSKKSSENRVSQSFLSLS